MFYLIRGYERRGSVSAASLEACQHIATISDFRFLLL